MKESGIQKWIVKATRDKIDKERLKMVKEKWGYALIQDIIRLMRERGMSEKAIQNALKLYN